MFDRWKTVGQSVFSFLAGPKNVIHIGPDGPSVSAVFRAFRPIQIFVDRHCLLVREITVPAEAKADLRHASELLVETETPFDRNEVLLCTAIRSAGNESLQAGVYILPRSELSAIEGIKGYSRARVQWIGIASPNAEERHIDFASSMNRTALWMRQGGLAAVLVFLVAANLFAASLSQERRRETLVAEVKLERLQRDLRVMTAEIERREAGLAQMAHAAPEPLSLVAVFADIAPEIQEDVEVRRMDGRSSTVRLFVVSADPLSSAKAIGDGVKGWQVSIDGAVQSEPDGRASAVVLLQRSSS